MLRTQYSSVNVRIHYYFAVLSSSLLNSGATFNIPSHNMNSIALKIFTLSSVMLTYF